MDIITNFRKINIDDNKEILSEMSKLKTTFFSINPYLDNLNLIKKKLVQRNINMYSAIVDQQIVGVFLMEIIEYTDDLAIVDFLCFQDNSDKNEMIIKDFLKTVQDIYNIGKFIKYEEIDDQRLYSFQHLGFYEIGNLKKHIFYNGVYQNQSIYFLNRRGDH